jgi:hypothetical protein
MDHAIIVVQVKPNEKAMKAALEANRPPLSGSGYDLHPDIAVYVQIRGSDPTYSLKRISNAKRFAFDAKYTYAQTTLTVEVQTGFIGGTTDIDFHGMMVTPQGRTAWDPHAPVELWFSFPKAIERVLDYVKEPEQLTGEAPIMLWFAFPDSMINTLEFEH